MRPLILACFVGLLFGACTEDNGEGSAGASAGSGGSAEGGAGAGSGAGASAGSGDDGGSSGGGSGGAAGSSGSAGAAGSGGLEITLPPPNTPLDYQLGGAYPPPDGVRIISRDRTEPIAPGLYNICYVNGFQIQPNEEAFWLEDHPDLILRDANGDPIVDQDWDEMLIDVSTAAKRDAVAEIVGEWIRGCAASGFDAVEIDNLDTYSRSSGLLTADHNLAAMRKFADIAHGTALAIAQKNSAEIVSRRAEMGTDFAVVEECNRYAECGTFVDAYDDYVLVIEYRVADFEKGCSEFPNLSIVLRDLNLTTPSSSSYVYDGC